MPFASKDLSTATTAELQSFLNSFDDIFCDCDGVLYMLSKPIEGAADAINFLKSRQKRVRFISNNCSMKFDDFKKKLANIGIECNSDDIVYPTLAIIDLLKSMDFNKKVYVIGTRAMKQELQEGGLILNEDGPYHYEESMKCFLENLRDNEQIGAVVIDWDLNVNYMALQKAVVYLNRPDVIFITGATDRRLPLSSKVKLIGPGYFQDAVEDLSGKKPFVFGKPGKSLSEFITRKYKITNPKRVLFIGDSIEQDMYFATISNYQKLLVLSGLTNEKDLEKWQHPEKYRPDYYIGSLAELPKIYNKELFD